MWKSANAGVGAKISAAANRKRRTDWQTVESTMRSLLSRIREELCPVNDDRSEVVHVGEGWPGDDQIADPLEKAGGIVVGEKLGRIEAKRPGALQGGGVDGRTGRVGGGAAAPVGAVRVGGERRDAWGAIERDGERQRVFLVRATAALAFDGDGELAARQQHYLAALGLQRTYAFPMLGCDGARLALDPVAQHDALVTSLAHDPLDGA